jgi:hypothetical protein
VRQPELHLLDVYLRLRLLVRRAQHRVHELRVHVLVVQLRAGLQLRFLICRSRPSSGRDRAAIRPG